MDIKSVFLCGDLNKEIYMEIAMLENKLWNFFFFKTSHISYVGFVALVRKTLDLARL